MIHYLYRHSYIYTNVAVFSYLEALFNNFSKSYTDFFLLLQD